MCPAKVANALQLHVSFAKARALAGADCRICEEELRIAALLVQHALDVADEHIIVGMNVYPMRKGLNKLLKANLARVELNGASVVDSLL